MMALFLLTTNGLARVQGSLARGYSTLPPTNEAAYSSLDIKVREKGDVTILELRGKITVGDGVIQLRNAVREQLEKEKLKIVINMEHVPYVDSAGLGELVSATASASRGGGKLKLAAITRKVLDLLIITKLLTVFDSYDTEDEAVKSF